MKIMIPINKIYIAIVDYKYMPEVKKEEVSLCPKKNNKKVQQFPFRVAQKNTRFPYMPSL